jgi:hypothetical protein
MKTFLIIFGVIFLLFVGSQIYFYKSSRNIEGYKFAVTKVYEGFEVRTYEASLFTSVKLDTELYQKASSKGFSILGGYIFGKNEKKERISMTSPVKISLKEQMTMQFLVPKNLTKDALPIPDNSSIEFVEVPERKMAAIRFSGWANDKKIEKYKLRLIALLDKNQIKYTNNFSLLGYNPPYELFFRKNEIIVELD